MTHRVVSSGKERVLKFNCKECENEPSIARSSDCMREVLQKLRNQTGISKILLKGRYVREYKDEDLSLLKEYTEALQDSRYQILKALTLEDCSDCEEERRARAERIWNQLERHPRKGIMNLEQMKKEMEEKSRRGPEKCKSCRKRFLNGGINPSIETISSTELFRKVSFEGDDRRSYEDLFKPTTRPSFLRSKLKLKPPEGGDLADAYELDETEVRIYHSSERMEYQYFVIPPEYRLSPSDVDILQEVKGRLLEGEGSLDPLMAREEVENWSRELIMEIALENGMDLEQEKIGELSKSIAKFTAGFGIIETLLEDSKVQDIYIDAPVGENPVYIYHQDFEECLTNVFFTLESAKAMTSKFRAICGRPFSEANPTLDLNLGNVRVAAIQSPLSPEGLAFAIRRHKSSPWTLPLFVKKGFMSPDAAGLLSLLVDSQASILITGSRGAGKTSLLGALILELLPKYRILCLEDTSELPIENFRSLGYKAQRLQVRPSNSGSRVEMSTEDALRAALRLGESVLIMGEVRGPETKSLYEAMRVGAAGNSVMGTIHGSSTKDVFERVVYDLDIPPSSFKATDAIVVASPIRTSGSTKRIRRLIQVSEVGKSWKEDPVSEDGFTDLMVYDSDDDIVKTTSALDNGDSHLLRSIARKWSMSVREVQKNFETRSRINEKLVEKASEEKSEFLEAGNVVESNLAFHRLLEDELRSGEVDYERLYDRWNGWLREAF